MFILQGQCRYVWNEIERALKHCRSRWDHLDIVIRRKVISTSGICSQSCNFWVKEASGDVGITPVTPPPKKKSITTEIASICVSVAKLLVLQVWSTVSTSGLYLMLLPVSEVRRCRYQWKWIGHAWRLCRSRWHHVDISSRHRLITTSGFRPPSWTYKCWKCQTRLAWVRRKTLRPKVTGISSLAHTALDMLLEVIPPLATNVITNLQ